MDIIEAARQLGKAIQQDKRYLAFYAAKDANDADESLQALIGRFNLIKMQVDEEMTKQEHDEEKVKTLNAELRKVYADIMVNENMQAYNNAKNDIDEVISRMNAIIDICIAGEDPDTCEPAAGCSGSCSTCSGCH